MYKVQVLLATYQGEKYLQAFLDSLIQQRDVELYLTISDDGSTDRTIEILNAYADKFEGFCLHLNNGLGAKNNFLWLLQHATEEFIAFADQDDVWHSNHLIDSVLRICNYQIPACTFSSVVEFESPSNLELRVWPSQVPLDSSYRFFFQNYARGCTMVLNRKSCMLINKRTPSSFLMHDWWVFLVTYFCGIVVFGEKPEIHYRLHENNHVGIPKHRAFSFISVLKKGSWDPYEQIANLLQIYEDDMDCESVKLISTLVQLRNTSFFKRIKFIFAHLKIDFRDTLIGDIKIKIGLIFLPLLTRNT